MKTLPFHIIPSGEITAQELTDLVSRNSEYWYRYFPLTIKKNDTLATSILFLIENEALTSDKKQFLFGVKDAVTATLFGLVYIKEIDWEMKQGELAYAIDKKVSGQGWMSQIVRIVSQKGFDMGLEKLTIITHKTNKGSVAVAENSGYCWEETLSAAFTPPGGSSLDMELYTLLKQNL